MNRLVFLLFATLVFIGCGSIKREYKTPIDLSAAVDRAVAETVVVVEPFEAVAVAGPYRVVVPPIEKGTLPPVEVSEKVVLEDADAHVLTWHGHVDDLHKQRAALVAQHESMGGEPVLSGGNTPDELEQDISNILRDIWLAHEAASAKVYENIAADYPDNHSVVGGNAKPEVVPPATDEVAEDTAADRTSFGEALANRHSSRAREERRTQQTFSLEEDSSLGRFSPPPRAQHTEEVTVVAEGGRTDSASAEPVAETDKTVVQGSSGWTDGTPEQRSAPNVQPGDAGTNPEDKRVAELEGALRGERLLRSHEKQRFWTVVVLVIVLPVVVFVLTFWLGRKGLKKEVGELEDSIYEVQRDREGLQEQVSNLKTRLDKLEADRHRLQRENKTLEVRLSVPPENLYEEVFRGLREQNDDLRTRLDVFREKLPEEVLSLFDEADTREKQEALLRPFWERMDHELVNMTRAHVIPTSCEETDPAIPRITTSDDGVVQPFGPRGRRGTKAS